MKFSLEYRPSSHAESAARNRNSALVDRVLFTLDAGFGHAGITRATWRMAMQRARICGHYNRQAAAGF